MKLFLCLFVFFYFLPCPVGRTDHQMPNAPRPEVTSTPEDMSKREYEDSTIKTYDRSERMSATAEAEEHRKLSE